MSLKTWKKEFYPKPADETTLEEALAHSQKKWEGLSLENMQRHHVQYVCGCVTDKRTCLNSSLPISGSTCALCQHYMMKNNTCAGCPLYEVRGVQCDDIMRGEEETPWHVWCGNEDPVPMQMWLQKAVDAQKEKST